MSRMKHFYMDPTGINGICVFSSSVRVQKDTINDRFIKSIKVNSVLHGKDK